MTTLPISTFYRQRGFSLIEALVAFLILSVGMLGIASLQTVSLRAGYTAVLRSAAVQENQEILERIRANNTDLDLGSGSNYAGTFTTSIAAPTTMCLGSSATCSPAEMAKYDVYEWMQDIKNDFPSGTTATVTVDDPAVAKTPHNVTVTINWTQRDPSSNGTINVNYSTDQLICDETCAQE